MSYQTILLIHILSSTLLFGTGLGTAFHGWNAHRSNDPVLASGVGRSVVLADWLFTTPAVIIQPLTGWMLARLMGVPLTHGWLALAILLYLGVGACWLPVVWIQLRMHRIASQAARIRVPLPPEYHVLARWWFILGWPAFAMVIAIFWLMVFTP